MEKNERKTDVTFSNLESSSSTSALPCSFAWNNIVKNYRRNSAAVKRSDLHNWRAFFSLDFP